MKVKVNDVDGDMSIQGVVVSFVPDDEQENTVAPARFKSTDVTQLLRSRKDMTSAKLVVDGKAYLLRFQTAAEREGFIDLIVRSQSAAEDSAHSPDQWIAASICSAAVDVGMLDQEELDIVLSDQYQRGVANVFDALESLVDSETLQLRVMTEQTENDVLRQIPILAAIFDKTVVDAETRRNFWEAVVRKYFCFSRTFLEAEMHQLGEAQGQQPADSTAPALHGLSAINATSLNAMPKASPHATTDGANVEHDDAFAALTELEAATDAPEEAISELTRLFRGSPQSTAQRRADLPRIKMVPCAPALTRRHYGPHVRHQLPTEATSREVLEGLRKFWRQTADQSGKVGGVPALPKNRPPSLIERLCVERAKEVAELHSQNTL